ncbi:hypothetical protein M378DRAFT_167624 [Amanita muscaria Koide BX008]|uniref:Uncharacterized protein n=1 Tax=Amanita muscaria (strain Koide BX008) TaxID=946122 RepID=A0A0C2SNT2_AMAMK|nr:hypothetical protein M378DRAFT_173458 [Amanita muscaria Koide BX008]KIL60947.1 hypothetical protein M378DRAFT_167624 [Amanita muscaria Koide BX008]
MISSALRIWPSRPWGDVVGFILYSMLPFQSLATGPNYMLPTPSATSSSYHTPDKLSKQHNDDVFDLVQMLLCTDVPGTTCTASSFCWHIEHWQAFWAF